MKTFAAGSLVPLFISASLIIFLASCIPHDEDDNVVSRLKAQGLDATYISASDFHKGLEPEGFRDLAGAEYRPSMNEDPGIPPQCWIETGYGTQNACQYCHTDYLASVAHGNAYPIGEDQILYSFPTPGLNNILWQNIIYPERLYARLSEEGINIPDLDDHEYVRYDNWLPAYLKGRQVNNGKWLNPDAPDSGFKIFPDLNPMHLFPYDSLSPTSGGSHGYIDSEGFVRDEAHDYTGWRAINFFPYAIFTPLKGSVSGIYIRLPGPFMTSDGIFSDRVYRDNLDLLEKNIKNIPHDQRYYFGDAGNIAVKKGFYPRGTEFAHPLHYTDLNADGEKGTDINGVAPRGSETYEFAGTRSKRVKEIRYMYKWEDVDLDDIAAPDEDEDEEEEGDGYEQYAGHEGEGWVDNGAGWILAGFIENRRGDLRPQTTEELAQCVGCHGKTGNTVDAVWSFQRKLPAGKGWRDMDYGSYSQERPGETRLSDYLREEQGMGEMAYFYHTVVGADLYGLMPREIAGELKDYMQSKRLADQLSLQYPADEILNDDLLKDMDRAEREPRLKERQAIMRHYSSSGSYLQAYGDDGELYLKGNIFYPSEATMKANIRGYRLIVLDQSYNLGKDLFGAVADNIPFTFRSDGSVTDSEGNYIPAGDVIYSRPWDSTGVGYTPTGIVTVNSGGEPVDADGNSLDPASESHKAAGHVSTGGTFDLFYNPVLSGSVIKEK